MYKIHSYPQCNISVFHVESCSHPWGDKLMWHVSSVGRGDLPRSGRGQLPMYLNCTLGAWSLSWRFYIGQMILCCHDCELPSWFSSFSLYQRSYLRSDLLSIPVDIMECYLEMKYVYTNSMIQLGHVSMVRHCVPILIGSTHNT